MEGLRKLGGGGVGGVSYPPAFAGLFLLLSDLQPFPQQEAFASWRGAGRGAAGPGGRGVFIAGRRYLNGRQLQVLLGAGARTGREVSAVQPSPF